jgi:hypothetical protein
MHVRLLVNKYENTISCFTPSTIIWKVMIQSNCHILKVLYRAFPNDNDAERQILLS